MKNPSPQYSRYQLFISYTLTTWILLIIFLVFCSTLRLKFLYHYDILSNDHLYASGWFSFYSVFFSSSLPTDLVVAAYLLLPAYAVGLCASLLGKSNSFIKNCYLSLICFLLCMGVLIMLANYYYFSAFANYFDANLFSFQGQANAVMAIIWHDYPFLRILVGVVFTGVISVLIGKNLLRIFLKRKSLVLLPLRQFFIVCIFLVVYSFAMGLALGPLQLNINQYRFDNPRLNIATSNGILAFYQALTTYTFPPILPVVTAEEGMADYNTYFGTHLTPKQFSLNSLLTHTSVNPFLAAHPPNVVFVQMESMGRHFLLYDQPGYNDMLGSLRLYTKSDFLFTHFLSGENATTTSLSRLTINANFLFTSPYNTVDYPTTVAAVYKQAGYETVFVNAGRSNYNDWGKSLLHQSYDQVFDEADIRKLYPHAQTEVWGVYDQYAFDYAFQLLKQANQQHKPIFIYLNTITNHPPFSLPATYHPAPLHLPADLANRIDASSTTAFKMLATYQYTNTRLGNFITAVDKTSFGARTIIAASGDHNQQYMIGSYHDDQEAALQYGVFFFLHVPPAYRQGTHIDTNQVGSHKDIFPTLYNLSLSHAAYLNLGNNLAGPAHHSLLEFGVNQGNLTILLPDGLITQTKLSNDLIKYNFYPWQDNKHIYVKPPLALTKTQQQLVNRINAYSALANWQLYWQYQLAQAKKISPSQHSKIDSRDKS